MLFLACAVVLNYDLNNLTFENCRRELNESS
jgi:hypothetical protein